MTINIVHALPQNSQAISQIKKAVWLDSYVNNELGITREVIDKKLRTSEDEKTRAKRAEKIKEDTSTKYWVAKAGNKVIGYCTAHKGDEVNKLIALNILPKYHGQGIGTKLLQEALTWLGNNKPITLRVISFNPKAITFYKKFGFVESGVKIDVPDELPNGKCIPRIELVKYE